MKQIATIITSLICIHLSGCSENKTLLEDADIFCHAHSLENWRDLPSDISMAEFSEIVDTRLKQAVKTDDFIGLVDQMNDVAHYRDMYSIAQKRVEALTGAEWACPEYETFYAILISRAEKPQTAAPDAGEMIIRITKDGEYIFNGTNLHQPSSAALQSHISDEVDGATAVMVHMAPGATDELLEVLFEALSSLGIETVRVQPDD